MQQLKTVSGINLNAEIFRKKIPSYGKFLIGVGYPNTYYIGMSSLGFQRVLEVAATVNDWGIDRFFLDSVLNSRKSISGRSFDQFDILAFSISFEDDIVNLLKMLKHVGIPFRSKERDENFPILILGGSAANINPIPFSPFFDVICLGAAENMLPFLLRRYTTKEQFLELLAYTPGFFVPKFHDYSLLKKNKLEKLELTEHQMRQKGFLPVSVIVTPFTEFSNMALIEMSRGCPEKCKYCWATFGMGKFRWHPTEYILEALEELKGITNRIGFLATAVGDHPQIEEILLRSISKGFRCSVSSIRIPAVNDAVLSALYASGARSITLAPETGNEALRAKMGKPISDATLLEKIELIFKHGFNSLKLYFIIGQPEETLDDVQSIVTLLKKSVTIMKKHAVGKGFIGKVTAGVNILVPKPFTPWQRLAFPSKLEVKRKLKLLKKEFAKIPNLRFSLPSYKMAVWHTLISRGREDVSSLLEEAALGVPISSLLRRNSDLVDKYVFSSLEGELHWHFFRTSSRGKLE